MKLMTKGLLAIVLVGAGIVGVSKVVCMMDQQAVPGVKQECKLEFVNGDQELNKLKDVYISFYSYMYKGLESQIKLPDLSLRFDEDKKLFASQADAFKIVRIQKGEQALGFAVLKELDGGVRLQLSRIALDMRNIQEAAACLRSNIFVLFPQATSLCNVVLKTSVVEIGLLKQFGFFETALIDTVNFKLETHTSFELKK